VAQHLLATRTQVSGESITDFAKALEHLSLQAYPEDPQLAAAASLSAFLGGLNDVTVRAILNFNPPADLASAVTAAKQVSFPFRPERFDLYVRSRRIGYAARKIFKTACQDSETRGEEEHKICDDYTFLVQDLEQESESRPF